MNSPTNAENEQLRNELQRLTHRLKEIEREQVAYLQNVSHQLVTPLNAIKWHIENLTSGRLSVERAQIVLKSVYSQATIAVHLAKNFALMSNLEADHSLAAIRESLEPIDSKRLMINLANDFQPMGWDKSIHVEVQEDGFEDAPDVYGMRALLQQVFSNIIENAIKYSDPSTAILISAKHKKDSDEVEIAISNKGIPLAPAECMKVFERGFRCEKAKARYPAGTGFGLYIANKIVELHDGVILARVDATTSRTIFEVSLPVSALKGRTTEWPKRPSS